MKQQNKKEETFIEFADRINKLGMKGPRDLSINLDHYLYGTPKKYIILDCKDYKHQQESKK